MSTMVHEDVESDGGSNDDDTNDENTDNDKIFKIILRKIDKSTQKNNIHNYLLANLFCNTAFSAFSLLTSASMPKSTLSPLFEVFCN